MGGTPSKGDKERSSRSTSPPTSTSGGGGGGSGDSSGEAGGKSPVAEVLHNGPIHSLCPILRDGCILSGGGGDKNVLVYSHTKQCREGVLQGPTKDITKICYNDKSNFVYASSRDRSIYTWKWPPEELESNLPPSHSHSSQVSDPNAVLEGHTLGVTSVDTSTDYPQLLCSGSRDNSVCLWDVDVGKPISSMYAPRNLVTDLNWISEEKAVVQASEDKTLRVWDLNTCSTVQQFRARNHLQMCCDVSHDQRQFLSGSSYSGKFGGEVSLWDRRNEKKPLKEFSGHTETVESCIFISHQNTSLMCSVCRGASIRLWQVDTGVQLCQEHVPGSGPLTDVAPLSGGSLACSSFTGGILLWTVEEIADQGFSLALQSKYM